MFTLPKHSDNANKKEKDLPKVEVDHWDVTRYVVRRQTKEVDGKTFFKVKFLPESKKFIILGPKSPEIGYPI